MRNEASGAFRIPNKRNVPCEECGRQAVLEVIPDGFYDPPESFGGSDHLQPWMFHKILSPDTPGHAQETRASS